MNSWFWIAPIGAILALVFAIYLAGRVKKTDQGSPAMIKISEAVRRGADAFLHRQHKLVLIVFIVIFVILGILALVGVMGPLVPFAFALGGFVSALSGHIGMKIATGANARTANACQHSLNSGLRVAFSAGGVMGFAVVGLGLAYVVVWYIICTLIYGVDTAEGMQSVASAMATFSMGAGFYALFARVGGGIFTKAADVGADLVGKVEAGIPEDDPRNPACIADNVGDNVGDVAGMGSDLYESYVASILSAIALSVAAGTGLNGLLAPMVLAAAGILASLIGTFFVSTKEGASQKNLLASLRKGVYIASILFAVLAFLVVYFMLGITNIGYFIAILCGLVAGNIIGVITEYYTSDASKPTKDLAESSETGSATVIISGLALGMRSTLYPVIVVCIAVLISYFCSIHLTDVHPELGESANLSQGLYGIALAAVGMLSTLGITLATDAYGPVADNAGGIAEMCHLDPHVRERTDALDSLGNTTAATGKGFAIGSAALTSLALIATFVNEVGVEAVKSQIENFSLVLDITSPAVLVGLFVGSVVPFLFAAMTMSSVGRSAQSIVVEVRRQFKEIPGLIEGTGDPDYEACVDLCTRSAQKEMIAPSLLGIISPVVVGLILGPNGLGGLLAGSLVSGFCLAVMMSNSGGAWDNAKKHIEAGHFGGKGSDNHKAAVVGDTVGDPFKDTSGPSINILIKLLGIVAVAIIPLCLKFNLLALLGV